LEWTLWCVLAIQTSMSRIVTRLVRVASAETRAIEPSRGVSLCSERAPRPSRVAEMTMSAGCCPGYSRAFITLCTHGSTPPSLRRASGFVRQQVCGALALKRTPGLGIGLAFHSSGSCVAFAGGLAGLGADLSTRERVFAVDVSDLRWWRLRPPLVNRAGENSRLALQFAPLAELPCQRARLTWGGRRRRTGQSVAAWVVRDQPESSADPFRGDRDCCASAKAWGLNTI
jgi:hypothetical protein